MRPQAHIAASLAIWSWGRDRPLREAPLCALAGNLPDLDRNVARAVGVKRRDHHRWVSHSLLGWLPPTLLVLGSRRTRSITAVRRSVLSLWVHLLLDTYADGLAWLWPWRKEKIGLFRRPESIVDDGWRTPAPLDTRLGQVEAALWAVVALNVAGRCRRG